MPTIRESSNWPPKCISEDLLWILSRARLLSEPRLPESVSTRSRSDSGPRSSVQVSHHYLFFRSQPNVISFRARCRSSNVVPAGKKLIGFRRDNLLGWSTGTIETPALCGRTQSSHPSQPVHPWRTDSAGSSRWTFSSQVQIPMLYKAAGDSVHIHIGCPSVRQIVNKIIHRDPVRQRRPLLRIPRIVRPLPGVAQIHVVADRDHHAALVVVNRAPVRSLSRLARFIRPAAAMTTASPEPGSDRPDRKPCERSDRSLPDPRWDGPEIPCVMLATNTCHSLTTLWYGSSPWKSSTIRNPPRSRKSRNWAA